MDERKGDYLFSFLLIWLIFNTIIIATNCKETPFFTSKKKVLKSKIKERVPMYIDYKMLTKQSNHLETISLGLG